MAAPDGAISLRPGGAVGISLRPGGTGGGIAGGFTSFAMGSRPQAPSESTVKRLSSDDVIKYTKDFIMAFQERCKDMPVELATSPMEVVINDVNEEQNIENDDSGGGGGGAQWGKKQNDGPPADEYKGGGGGG
eukprot:CAMPEP_0181362192 /NCGR_PEP_ID=MMETSP1106-20121128/7827_1 /TAXON_ID=81844 /ORGANISM="Mantoniella antarctica, Strain SL-175" /LENGTH=132 /DNA_ID=CAMNT_0023476033 /DNA_START=163 /DNA_END=558 /DNA_ORIENTATION=+